jgi:hypothetical protein
MATATQKFALFQRLNSGAPGSTRHPDTAMQQEHVAPSPQAFARSTHNVSKLK